MEEAEKAKKDKNELRKGKKRLKRGKCSIDMGEKNKNGRERRELYGKIVPVVMPAVWSSTCIRWW